MSTETLTRSSLLEDVAEAAPEEAGCWEVHLAYRMASMNSVVDFKAVVDFVRLGAFFSGRAGMAYVTGGREMMRVPAAIEGELTADLALLDVRLQEGAMKQAPFHCSGEARPDGQQYEGKWHMPCLRPDTCGCDGNSGYFSLTRVD
ncbi:hypothetical protein [Henriciella litoralis]|uniref:hypothetical protein n=1 Tax=Henriciella litoralis TaxID=568102 RepID=UPI0009FDEA0E|nr:hypothetical protein [Henriciella litoralis]